MGFYPVLPDTSKKPDNGQKECLCPSEDSIAPSSSRGLSWHLVLDGILSYATSQGGECRELDPDFAAMHQWKCKVPSIQGDAYSVKVKSSSIWLYKGFTNVDNKPISEMDAEWNKSFKQWEYAGRTEDGQLLKVTFSDDIILENGTLGKGGPTM